MNRFLKWFLDDGTKKEDVKSEGFFNKIIRKVENTHIVMNGDNLYKIDVEKGEIYVSGKMVEKKDTPVIILVQKGAVLTNVSSDRDITIYGSVSTVTANNVTCEGVKGNINAGGDVTCDNVEGNIETTGNITCEDIRGEVRSGRELTCDSIKGNISANGNVSCEDVDGDVKATGDVDCDDVRGDIEAGGNVSCDDVDGSVVCGSISCDTINGRVTINQ